MSVQDRMNDYWSRRAPAYDAGQHRPEHRGRDRALWAEVWSAALPPAPADVLDLGCGSGYVTTLLAGLGHRVTGIDLADGMLEVAQQRVAELPATTHPPRLLRGDMVAPDFPDDSFDVLAGRYVLWTLREPGAALAAWRRVLRPDGVLAMVDSTWFPDGLGSHGSEDFTGSYDDRVRAALPLAEATSIEASAQALRDGGFRDVEVTPLTGLLELDRAHGAAPGHDVRLQFLLTARP